MEFDHHAFLYWGPEQLAVFPVQTWGWDEETQTETHFGGALAYRIDPQTGIHLVGTIEHTQGQDQIDEFWYGGDNIQHSIMIGDQLFTLSDQGLQRNALADLDVAGELLEF